MTFRHEQTIFIPDECHQIRWEDHFLKQEPQQHNPAATMDDIKKLEQTTNQVIDMLVKTKAENRALNQKLIELTQEKSQLMQKNDQAKTRLESMISRLKSLEQTA